MGNGGSFISSAGRRYSIIEIIEGHGEGLPLSFRFFDVTFTQETQIPLHVGKISSLLTRLLKMVKFSDPDLITFVGRNLLHQDTYRTPEKPIISYESARRGRFQETRTRTSITRVETCYCCCINRRTRKIQVSES